MKAALAAGARRYVTQSIAFLYAPEGDLVKDEEARPYDDAPAPLRPGREGDARPRAARCSAAEGIEGLVLRYGQFYGPGTYYDRGGSIEKEVAKRRCPWSAPGTGHRLLHPRRRRGARRPSPPSIMAAPASTTSPTTSRRRCANGCRSTPRRVGAKRPLKVPAWLARLVAGKLAVEFGVNLRGASNEKAKRELGWSPATRAGGRASRKRSASAPPSRIPA